LVLVLAACASTIEDQGQVRELEERLSHFPPAELVAENLGFSGQHLCWLREAGASIPSHRREAYAAHLAEAELLYDTWVYLDLASFHLKLARRLAARGRMGTPHLGGQTTLEIAAGYIEALETLLGEEAFLTGRMPPPVPYWRFQWVD
jgi:hypothetical protein